MLSGHMDIYLENGGIAVIDDEDAHLAQYVWSRVDRPNGVSYAVRRDSNRNYRPVRMHREVMGFPDGPVDHINGDGLLNRKSNLRICTQTENARNVSGPTRVNTTGFRGVSIVKKTGRYRARICVDGKKISVGVYATPEEANEARLYAERQTWGITPRRAEFHEASGCVSVRLVTRPNWTKEEDSVLKASAGKGARAVADIVGRTPKAVYNRAQVLGLSVGTA